MIWIARGLWNSHHGKWLVKKRIFLCGYVFTPFVRLSFRHGWRNLLWKLVFSIVGGGYPGPPNSKEDTDWIPWGKWDTGTSEGRSFVGAEFKNDAHEIWLAWRFEEDGEARASWKFYCDTPQFRRIAAWYLWRWAWGEWLGLRRKLYFKALRFRIRGNKERV